MPFESKKDSAQVLVVSIHISGFVVFIILSLVHATLPIRLKDDASVKKMRFLMMVPLAYGGLACWQLGVKPWPQPTYFESM